MKDKTDYCDMSASHLYKGENVTNSSVIQSKKNN